MSVKVQLKGGICEFDFGYNAKMDGYTTLMSDIQKLYAIGFGTPEIKRYKKNKIIINL